MQGWTEEHEESAATFGPIKLHPAALQGLLELFNRLDNDHSGGLDASDFAQLATALCPADQQRITRRNQALRDIVAELKLGEADTDGDGTVDFSEFVEAFKTRALHEKIVGPAAEATFIDYYKGLETELNKRVVLMVSQMAQRLSEAGQ
eukprot:g8259.t1